MVTVRGAFAPTIPQRRMRAACRGLGVGYGPFWQIVDLVDRGALQIVLDKFEPPKIPIYAVSPPSAMAPAKTRLFIDMLVERLARERL